MFEMIKKLTELNGTSGAEHSVRSYIISEIKDYADIKTDNMGNIIAFVRGKKRAFKKVMADAHMDEVGFIITSVTADGFLKFETVGGIETAVLLARRIVTERGVKGVISMKPVHLLSSNEKTKQPDVDSLYIDIGVSSKEEALKLVNIGETAVFMEGFEPLGSLFVSKAIDDRAGVAILIDIIKNAEYDFYAVFSVQEEVGLRGAKAAAFSVDPQYAVVIESTTAADIKGVAEEKTVCNVGSGAVLSFMDKATMYDRSLFLKAKEIADEKNIPCQIKRAVAGGNNAGAINTSRGGVKTLAISVPCRYIHSAGSVASKEDIMAVRLLAEQMIYLMASGKIDD